jgi:hypothetical protein
MRLQQSFLLLLLLLGTVWTSCKKMDEPPTPEPENPYEQMDLSQMAVGQKSKYVILSANNYNNPDDNTFQYHNDTLVMEIIASDANGFKIKESLKYNESVISSLDSHKDSIFYYYLQLDNDTIRAKPISGNWVESRFWVLYGQTTGLPVSAFSGPSVQILGWKTNLPYCECKKLGKIDSFTLFDENYTNLNLIRDDSDMALDGPGRTYVYDAKRVVRFTLVSWWTQEGYGFDLVP